MTTPLQAELLTLWFRVMDSDTPEQVLDFITDDFQLAIVFSTGTGGTVSDFSGDRAALVSYLQQREVNTRTHIILSTSRVGDHEHVLGEVQRQGGQYEASFTAAALLDESGHRVRRLLIGRSPGARFTD
jgi:hypothetical protein